MGYELNLLNERNFAQNSEKGPKFKDWRGSKDASTSLLPNVSVLCHLKIFLYQKPRFSSSRIWDKQMDRRMEKQTERLMDTTHWQNSYLKKDLKVSSIQPFRIQHPDTTISYSAYQFNWLAELFHLKDRSLITTTTLQSAFQSSPLAFSILIELAKFPSLKEKSPKVLSMQSFCSRHPTSYSASRTSKIPSLKGKSP